MTPTLRPATPADLDEILTIAGHSPEAPHWRVSDYAAYLAGSPDPLLLRTALVVISGKQIVGFAAATLLLDGEQNRCELDSIAVHPAARRQGVGSSLVQAVLSWAARHGARRVGLEVRAGNSPAIRLYQREGFAAEGLRPGYYPDPAEDALLLGRPVTTVSEAAPFSTGNRVEDGRPRC